MPTFDAVQTNYDRVMQDGLPGSPADANPTVKETFIAETDTIGYGLVVSRASYPSSVGGAQTAKLGTGGQIAATKGFAQGVGVVVEDIPTWKAITAGSFKISINGAEQSITGLDFNAVTDLAGVAGVIQTALQAVASGGYTAATCVYSTTTRSFTITSGTTGATSTVSDLSDAATGTAIAESLGMDVAYNVDGKAATTLKVLGITFRSVTSESVSRVDSGTAATAPGETGVVQRDGTIKVLAMESASDNSSVYFSDTTGEIYFTSGTGRTQLGSAKLKGNATAGEVAIVDVVGVR